MSPVLFFLYNTASPLLRFPFAMPPDCLYRLLMAICSPQLQDAVTSAHETSTEFSDEVLKEHNVFELSKQEEMREMWSAYAKGQIEMYKQVSWRGAS